MKLVLAICLTALAAVLPAEALVPGAAGEGDPFAAYLFPPERVMSHSLELGLDDAQKTAIKNEVQNVQGKFVDLQEKPVDETKVLAEVDRILALEKDIKKMQVTLLVRVKNILTPAQQAKLTELQKAGAK